MPGREVAEQSWEELELEGQTDTDLDTLKAEAKAEVDTMLSEFLGDKEVEKKAVKFDDILEDLGQFGRYQKFIYFFIFLPTIFSAMQKQSWVFLGAKAQHRCRLTGETLDSPYINNGLNLSLYIPLDGVNGMHDSCTMYEKDNNNVIPCQDGWVYDRTTFGSSAVMDWDLVCEKKGMRATAQSLFMVGVLIGSYVFGKLSDVWGRKKAFYLSVVIQAVAGTLSGLAPEYWSFTILRMVVGATTSGVFLVAYVIALEMIGSKYRVLAGAMCSLYYTFANILMALIAYFLNTDWKLLQIVLTLPSALFFSYWFFVPESIRWQIVRGKFNEAKEQLNKVAKWNKVELDDEKVDSMINTVSEENNKALVQQSSLADLFRSPTLRWRSLNLCFSWMVISGTYYGLSLGVSNLGGNPYNNYFISAAAEIPGFFFKLLVLDRPSIGRKRALSGCMLFGGTMLIATIFVPKDMGGLLIGLSMMGKMAISASYGIIYIFSAELYPTTVRNVGLGMSSMAARIGGILCPYINLLSDVWVPLPQLIYGALAFTGGGMALALPETLGHNLPETIAESENLSNKKAKE